MRSPQSNGTCRQSAGTALLFGWRRSRERLVVVGLHGRCESRKPTKCDATTQHHKAKQIFEIVRGAALVVWAIRDGRDAADNIHAYLKAKAPALAAAE